MGLSKVDSYRARNSRDEVGKGLHLRSEAVRGIGKGVRVRRVEGWSGGRGWFRKESTKGVRLLQVSSSRGWCQGRVKRGAGLLS